MTPSNCQQRLIKGQRKLHCQEGAWEVFGVHEPGACGQGKAPILWHLYVGDLVFLRSLKGLDVDGLQTQTVSEIPDN